jgi:hypothetical protein
MAVPKRTVRDAPGADRKRVAECPSVMAREDATIALGDVNRPGVRVNGHRVERRKCLACRAPPEGARSVASMGRPSSRNGIPFDVMRPLHRAQSVLTAAGPRFESAGDQRAAGMRPSLVGGPDCQLLPPFSLRKDDAGASSDLSGQRQRHDTLRTRRTRKTPHPKSGPIWVQNRPNTGQNDGLADTRKQDESTT